MYLGYEQRGKKKDKKRRDLLCSSVVAAVVLVSCGHYGGCSSGSIRCRWGRSFRSISLRFCTGRRIGFLLNITAQG